MLPQIILGAFAVLAFIVSAISGPVAVFAKTKPRRDAAWRVFRLTWVTFVASAAAAVLQLYADGLL